MAAGPIVISRPVEAGLIAVWRPMTAGLAVAVLRDSREGWQVRLLHNGDDFGAFLSQLLQLGYIPQHTTTTIRQEQPKASRPLPGTSANGAIAPAFPDAIAAPSGPARFAAGANQLEHPPCTCVSSSV